MSHLIKTVLFDLDGTLIDTNNLILTSFQYTLDHYFPGKFTRDDLIPFIGESLESSFSQVSPKLMNEMISMYREHNSRYHDRLVTEFPYVRETLAALKADGCSLGVVSTKKRDMVERGLRLTRMADFFETVVTSDDVMRLKPDPEPVERAMNDLSAQKESTVMVGDSPSDILAGENAHVRTAAVGWSLKGRTMLERLNPDYLLDNMKDLLNIVRHAKVTI
ncbi:pyrophosphatase PpaX [Sporolactobacillus shoreicorticis]|uniref:Pyrophosphatase PpaX n=1 Tax=Sporolactobacillus shoreicorticis TaxID=1923877 RepID=A0ABW5RY33_9BACL|nr:pyrophosphatase PpaX [Sporolactobacillus shoreicorticis]MCO7125040.1 pyrophosphatase PpaX [Sporolactobacillus shoreicorticis]